MESRIQKDIIDCFLLNKNHGEFVMLLHIITHSTIILPKFPSEAKEMARENKIVQLFDGLSWNLHPHAKNSWLE